MQKKKKKNAKVEKMFYKKVSFKNKIGKNSFHKTLLSLYVKAFSPQA